MTRAQDTVNPAAQAQGQGRRRRPTTTMSEIEATLVRGERREDDDERTNPWFPPPTVAPARR